MDIATPTKDSVRIFVRHPSVSTRILEDGGAVLYHADKRSEKFVNLTGFHIWQVLDGRLPINGVAKSIIDHFELAQGDQITADLQSYISELLAEDYLLVQDVEDNLLSNIDEFPQNDDAPRTFDISLTGRCNLRCAYCFYHDEMVARPDLVNGEWLDFFYELGQLAVRDVTLSGGEIFVRQDVWELIDGVIDNRMCYSINSNGTLINEEVITALTTGKRRTRLNSIQLSIDGSCAEVHDKSRGYGSFDKAIRGLRLLKEAGIPVTVRVTVNRHNIGDLPSISRFLLDDMGLPGFSTNDAMPMGAGCSNQKNISLTPKQQVQAMYVLSTLAETYNGRISAMAGPLAKWRCYQEMEQAKKTGEKSVRWKMGFLSACGCVYSKLSVHHDGIITPCNMLAKLGLGCINKDSIKTIWKEHPLLREMKDRRLIPMAKVLGCENCEWNEYCNGSCPGLAYEMTGSLYRANPHDCYRNFLEQTGGIF